MTISSSRIGSDMLVFERGWLSANNVLFRGRHGTAIVDTGYATHAAQTLALVREGLDGGTLDVIVNTHLHSDHCGGNAALQLAYSGVRTYVPPGQAGFVEDWDPVALTYVPTGQQCPQFTLNGVLRPGTEVALGNDFWQVHGAPGHDPHSVVLFEPAARTLISADALWENGFGVVFPELEGETAFAEVGSTLDVIERLNPETVIPGHGSVFVGSSAVDAALGRARSRLAAFTRDPGKHGSHAMKVLLKFRMLEVQQCSLAALIDWASASPYFRLVGERYFPGTPASDWITAFVAELCRSNVLHQEHGIVFNA